MLTASHDLFGLSQREVLNATVFITSVRKINHLGIRPLTLQLSFTESGFFSI